MFVVEFKEYETKYGFEKKTIMVESREEAFEQALEFYDADIRLLTKAFGDEDVVVYECSPISWEAFLEE